VVNRGVLNTGEKGGTDPYKGGPDDFKIEKLPMAAYTHDKREMQLAPEVTP
jgi:hypothetical protein